MDGIVPAGGLNPHRVAVDNKFSRYTSQALNTSPAQKPGPLAQSVEQRTFNPWVVGSIPTGPTQ